MGFAPTLEQFKRWFNKRREYVGTIVVPSGSTWKEPCHVCGELPQMEPHQIYVLPICEGCFWEVDDPVEIGLQHYRERHPESSLYPADFDPNDPRI